MEGVTLYPLKHIVVPKGDIYHAMSKQEIKDRKLADMTKRTVFSVLEGTYDKEKFVAKIGRAHV